MTVMVGMYLLSFPLPWISEALSNSLQYTFGKYEGQSVKSADIPPPELYRVAV